MPGIEDWQVVASVSGRTGDVSPTPEMFAPATLVLVQAAYTVRQVDHGKTLVLRPGAALAFEGASLQVGARIEVQNETGADVTPAMTGFTPASLQHPLAATRILDKGWALFLVTSPTVPGTTKQLRAMGAVA